MKTSAVALAVLMVWAGVAPGQVYRPEVPIALVAHEGEPVPGIPGATFDGFAPPKIDAQGNVLLVASMSGPGIDDSNDLAMWFGQPGALAMVARDGDPAPDMPPGVIYASVSYFEVVSETGWIAFTAIVSGPGITEDVNDTVVFCGPPGDFQLVLQAGDPVPGIGPEVTISATDSLGATISDNGTLDVGAGVIGPGLPWGTRAHWMGPRDAPQLAFWEGMPVPGCEDCADGVILASVDLISHNDAGQMAFRGRMSGPGIYASNDTGRWIGFAGGLELMHREGQPAPEFGEGVTLDSASGILYAFNRHGDKANRIRLQGPGITGANDWVIVAGAAEPLEVVAREGDLTPEAESGSYLEYVGNALISDRREALYNVAFGDGVPGVFSGFGIYFGPYGDPELILETGRPAPYFEPGLVFRKVNYSGGRAVLNDVGDIVTYTQVGPPEGAEDITDVLWLRHAVGRQWVPILWSGLEIKGRTVTVDEWGELAYYWTRTGGSDSLPQNFNDLRQLVVQTQFTDGTRGIYRLGPPLLGDTDGDGVVTLAEMATFAGCMTGPGGECGDGCDALDFDLDSDIDFADFAVLQALFGEGG